MGWLRELIREKKGDISNSEVARQLRKAPFSWPEKGVDARSFATYLGDFDKHRKLDWLEQHPKVEALLASYLDITPEELRARTSAEPVPSSAAESAVISLWEVETRRIDLRQEPLPPAFPREVLDPKHWPVLWRAPSGSGRSLVGRWLDARGKARFIMAENWAEAAKQLGEQDQPVFIELISAEGLPPSSQGLSAICIAVDGAPAPSQPVDFAAIVRRARQERPFDWPQVAAPPVESWLKALVAWVAERLPASTDFDEDACLEWMRRALLPERIMDRFETALGFIGLFVKFSGRIRKGQSQMDLVRLFLRMRGQQVDSAELVPTKPLLEALMRLARRLLLEERRSWRQARSRAEWFELLHSRPDAEDLAYLQELSTRYSLGLDTRKLRDAAKEQPPGAHRVFQQLQQLQLLREKGPKRYVLQPSWLLTTLLQDAADRLLKEEPKAWGSVLLSQDGSLFVLRRLYARCGEGDWEPVRNLLEAPALESAPWVAALECTFRVLGLLTLLGRDVPRELLEQIMVLQQRLVTERHEEPRPRLGFSDERDDLPMSLSGWFLAAHAMVEKLGFPQGRFHPVFTLEREAASPEVLNRVLSEIAHAVLTPRSSEVFCLSVLSLYGRLLSRTGSLPSAIERERAHTLQLPEFLFQRFRDGEFEWEDFGGFHPWSQLFPLLRKYLEQRQVSWADFQRALWKAWLASGAELAWWMSRDEPWREELWSHIPPEGIRSGRLAAMLQEEWFPYDKLGPEQWSAFLDQWKAKKAPELDERIRAWECVPARFVEQALFGDVIHPHESSVFETLWRTAAPTVSKCLRDMVRQGRWPQAMNLAWSAPPEERPDLLEFIRAEARREDAPRGMIIFWLQGLIKSRAPEWRRAWELLHELAPPAAAR